MKLAGGGVAARWLALVGYLTTPFLVFTYNFSPDVLVQHWLSGRIVSPCADGPSGRAAGGPGGMGEGLYGLRLIPLAVLIFPMGWRKTFCAAQQCGLHPCC
jgi:hypothetical protein